MVLEQLWGYGRHNRKSGLSLHWLVAFRVRGKRRIATPAFARFVAEGQQTGSPWKDLKNQIYLGSDRFVEQMQQRIRDDQPLQEIPVRRRRPVARALAYYVKRYPSRDRAIAEAYRSGAYSMQEIGVYFGVGRMTVSRAVKKHELASDDAGVQWET